MQGIKYDQQTKGEVIDKIRKDTFNWIISIFYFDSPKIYCIT